MDALHGTERVETAIIGGGQAGLATAYYLKERGRPFVILDAGERVGDAWRTRWESLRLFTPARFDSLPGFPFPGSNWSFPTKDEMADYLEAYVERFDLPVRTGVKVERLEKEGGRFVITSSRGRFEAENVVVATGACQNPKVPGFADQLRPDITQLHSKDYLSPSQLTSRRRPRRGCRQFGRRDLEGAVRDEAHAARGEGVRAHPGPPRKPALTARVPRLPVRRSSCVDARDADRTEARAEALRPRRSVDPGQAEGPRRRRHRAGPPGRRSPGRSAGARGRPGAGRGERHLVHGVPIRLRMDRPARSWETMASPSTTAASSGPNRACTSSDSRSNTHSRPTSSPACRGITPSSRTTSPRAGPSMSEASPSSTR